MTDYPIDCVHTPDRNSPHERITHVGGRKPGGGRWRDTVAKIVALIESNQHRFYTTEGGSSIIWVGVRTTANGTKFLQTHIDGVWRDNLLALPKCKVALSAKIEAIIRRYHNRLPSSLAFLIDIALFYLLGVVLFCVIFMIGSICPDTIHHSFADYLRFILYMALISPGMYFFFSFDVSLQRRYNI